METLLEVKNVSIEYRNADTFQAVSKINFQIQAGEFVAIIGRSGCGKTTLLHAIAGFMRPSQGEILFDGRAVVAPNMERSILFQHHALFPWKTALENVSFPLRQRGLYDGQSKNEAANFLRQVGLSEFEKRYPNELSGGMQQRVALARLLASKPKLMLMDEPFGSLDALTRRQMQDLLLSLWKAEPTAIVFVTHDVDEAILLADRILLMTSRPGTIAGEIQIKAKRPRDLFVEETIAVRKKVVAFLQCQTDIKPDTGYDQAHQLEEVREFVERESKSLQP